MIVASDDNLRRALRIMNKGVSTVVPRSVSVLIVAAFVGSLAIASGEVRFDRLKWLCGPTLDIPLSCVHEADVGAWTSCTCVAPCPRFRSPVRALTMVVIAMKPDTIFPRLGKSAITLTFRGTITNANVHEWQNREVNRSSERQRGRIINLLGVAALYSRRNGT